MEVVGRLLEDERVARDLVTLREYAVFARKRGHDDVALQLERHCAARR